MSAFLEHVDRLLIPGGHLLLTLPNRWTVRNRVRWLLGLPLVRMDPTHIVRTERTPPSAEYSAEEVEAEILQSPVLRRRYQLRWSSAELVYFPRWVEKSALGRTLTPLRLRQWVTWAFPGACCHFMLVLEKDVAAH